MKKTFWSFTALAAIFLTACGGSDSGENTDTLSAAESTTTTSVADNGSSNPNGGTTRQYKDVYTGSDVQLEKDPATGYYMNVQTHQPIDFYTDPATADTFDMRGRVVNSAIIRDKSGRYKVDETKVKFQSDGDLKIKDAEGNKAKLETDGDAKFKDADGNKIKIDDGKVKVKEIEN